MSGYKIPLISIIYDTNYQDAVVTNNHVCNLLSDMLKRLHIAHRLSEDTHGIKNISIESLNIND